ncbi:Cytochrome, mitochondrial [Armadillidium nasatum]|uniref:Cytochrome, mitochondrial n=1 Tax=Armadillidium nasatum TaxID=96803 RepID=A0A5N5SRI9_9CRUS|nr:Cytochrome, mitochondrial [Armadillidium nasatum]
MTKNYYKILGVHSRYERRFQKNLNHKNFLRSEKKLETNTRAECTVHQISPSKRGPLWIYVITPDTKKAIRGHGLPFPDCPEKRGDMISSYTTSFILYHVAKHSEKQEKLSQEATHILNESRGIVTEEVLNKATYTKAVFKESLRMNPVSVGIGRIASKDFVLRDFQVPKGTVIVTQNQVSCRLEEYFDEPNSFIPERWLEKSSGRKNPFVFLPFGHGPRSCIGRRLAEQNIYCFLLQFFKHFKIYWTGKDLDCYSYLINEPDSKLSFEFVLRK